MRNMDTGDLSVFHVNAWLSSTKDDRQLFRDIAATVRGKSALKRKLRCSSCLTFPFGCTFDVLTGKYSIYENSRSSTRSP